MKTISLNTDKILIGSSSITYYGESLKSFGVTGNPKIFELDKDKFNLNIYGSIDFTGSGRINLNGTAVNLNSDNIKLSGSNISLYGNINLNGSQNFNISAYTGGTIRLSAYNDTELKLSGSSLYFNGKNVSISGEDLLINTSHLSVETTGDDTKINWYTGKTLMLNGANLNIHGSVSFYRDIELNGYRHINGSFIEVNGNSEGSMIISNYNCIDVLTTGSNANFRFGAQNSCFIEGNERSINVIAGYITGTTGVLRLNSRGGDIQLSGSNIKLSGNLTITVGSETYLFTGGSFVLQS